MPENILYMNGEETLSSMGKKKKTFSYIDETRQQYVVLDCKLKESITEMDLKRFFNQVYSAKLSNAYEKIFDDKYTTLDLINCFKEFLKEDHVINLKNFYELLSKEKNANWTPLMAMIQEFFTMFDFSAVYYPEEAWDAMKRYASMNPWFVPEDSSFPEESQAMYYNSWMINIINDNSKLKLKSKAKKKELQEIHQKAS